MHNAEVEYTAFSLAKRFMTWDESIPDFGTRFPNVLESCLATPFSRFSRKDLYRGMIGKGSMLFYLLVKNHPFQNGNKRIALVTLLLFLYKNGKWLGVDNQELLNFAVWVAQSPASLKQSTIGAVEEFIRAHLVKL